MSSKNFIFQENVTQNVYYLNFEKNIVHNLSKRQEGKSLRKQWGESKVNREKVYVYIDVAGWMDGGVGKARQRVVSH